MEILNLKSKEAIETLVNCVKTDKENIIFCCADDVMIGIGIYKDWFDENFCKVNNFTILYAHYPAGPCVVSKGNLVLLGYEHGPSEIGKEFIECVNNFLHTKNISSEIIGNDIIITEGDIDYKVGSYASAWVNNDTGTETAANISMNIEMDLIEKICKKPMEKIPKGLSEYGIKTTELIDYLNKNMNKLKGQLNKI